MGNGNLSKKRGFLSEITSDALDYISGKLEALIPSKMSQLENDGDFVSDAQYVHTDNNYTDAEQAKVANLPDDTDAALDGKVDKVSGKGLSSNDFEDAYKDLLDQLPNIKIINSTSKDGFGLELEEGLYLVNEDYSYEEKTESTDGIIGVIKYYHKRDIFLLSVVRYWNESEPVMIGGTRDFLKQTKYGYDEVKSRVIKRTKHSYSGDGDIVELSAFPNGSDTEFTLESDWVQLIDADGNIPSARIPQLAEKADKTELIGKAGTGQGAEVFNDYANNEAAKTYAHAEGFMTKAYGLHSHAEGSRTITGNPEVTTANSSGDYAHAEGYNTKATGIQGCHVEGYETISSGGSTHAEGFRTTASGMYGAHTEGRDSTASGDSAHAEGYGTQANGDNSHAEGYGSKAITDNAHAEGEYTNANGVGSHAEGAYTHATGDSSHTEGYTTTASASCAHAEGWESIASGVSAHAEGYGTTAASESQHVQGKYNIEDSDGVYAHIVGNGTSSTNRSNAHTLDWDGNAWYAGKVTVGADAEELATKSDVHTARPYVEETLPEVLALNTIYDLGTQTSVTLKLPSANVGNFIQVDFLCGDTPATFTIDAASSAIVSDYDFTPEPDKAYSLFFDYGRLAGSLYGWRFSYAEYTYTEV